MIFPISLLPLVVKSGRVAGQLLIVSKKSPDWAGRKPGREPFSTFVRIFHYSLVAPKTSLEKLKSF